MTLVETVIASFIFTIIGMGVVSLLIITAREQRVGFVEQRVFEEADRLQDRITRILQGASRDAGVFFDHEEGAYFRRIVFREGIGKANQSLYFDKQSHILEYDPDMSISGNEKKLGMPGESIALPDMVKFRSAMKTGGIPDSAIILVVVEVSDHGYGKSAFRDISEKTNWIMSSRTFAVNLRRY